jgi:hypothetical protein
MFFDTVWMTPGIGMRDESIVGQLKNPSQNLSIRLTLVLVDSTTNFDSTRIVSALDYFLLNRSSIHAFIHAFLRCSFHFTNVPNLHSCLSFMLHLLFVTWHLALSNTFHLFSPVKV